VASAQRLGEDVHGAATSTIASASVSLVLADQQAG
jgi:hypothetical protein